MLCLGKQARNKSQPDFGAVEEGYGQILEILDVLNSVSNGLCIMQACCTSLIKENISLHIAFEQMLQSM